MISIKIIGYIYCKKYPSTISFEKTELAMHGIDKEKSKIPTVLLLLLV